MIVVAGYDDVPTDVIPLYIAYVVPVVAPDGGVNETVAPTDVLETRTRPVGAANTVVAVNVCDIVDPAEFVTVIVNEYCVLLVNPLIVKP